MKLDHYIAALLEEHDCVIVPDFGGFVANYAPAKINPVNNRFDPPYRKVSFNKLLVHNDGLLAAYIAQKEEERYEEALKEIKNYVLYLRSSLKEHQKVQIEKVGLLLKQADGTYRFEQVKNPAMFRDGFGLESFFGTEIERKPGLTAAVEPKSVKKEAGLTTPPVKKVAPPVKPQEAAAADDAPQPKKAPEDEPKVIPIDREKDSQSAPKRSRKLWPVAAAAVSVPFIGYALWLAVSTPLFSDRSQFHYSDLNPFTEKVCAVYKTRAAESAFEESTVREPVIIHDHDDYLEMSLDHAPDKTLVVRLVEPKASAERNTSLRYHIIGGCFSEDSNAERMVARFRARGSNASIIDRKGALARVSIASFATKKEALEQLASYQNDIAGAWLLYK